MKKLNESMKETLNEIHKDNFDLVKENGKTVFSLEEQNQDTAKEKN